MQEEKNIFSEILIKKKKSFLLIFIIIFIFFYFLLNNFINYKHLIEYKFKMPSEKTYNSKQFFNNLNNLLLTDQKNQFAVINMNSHHVLQIYVDNKNFEKEKIKINNVMLKLIDTNYDIDLKKKIMDIFFFTDEELKHLPIFIETLEYLETIRKLVINFKSINYPIDSQNKINKIFKPILLFEIKNFLLSKKEIVKIINEINETIDENNQTLDSMISSKKKVEINIDQLKKFNLEINQLETFNQYLYITKYTLLNIKDNFEITDSVKDSKLLFKKTYHYKKEISGLFPKTWKFILHGIDNSYLVEEYFIITEKKFVNKSHSFLIKILLSTIYSLLLSILVLSINTKKIKY
jgi:hypothetical protein